MAEETSDAELLAKARRQDQAAIAELYERHRSAARRLAGTYRRAGDPDDLVSEAFFKVFGALGRGSGPDDSFRAYLFVTLRRTAMEAIAKNGDEPMAEVPEPVRAEAREPALDLTDRQMIMAAYASLPGRQQSVLWQTAVEGRKPRELTSTFGLSANAVSATASRARDQLREAYLQAHVAAAPRPQCEPHRSRLGAFVRDGLATRDRTDTQSHLDQCEACRDLVFELQDVNRMLVLALLPFFVEVSNVGALAAATTASATTGGALASVRRLLSKGRSNPGVAAAGAMAAVGLAAAVVSGFGDDGSQAGSQASPPPSDAVSSPAAPDEEEPDPISAPNDPTTTTETTAPPTPDASAGQPRQPATPDAPPAPTPSATPQVADEPATTTTAPVSTTTTTAPAPTTTTEPAPTTRQAPTTTTLPAPTTTTTRPTPPSTVPPPRPGPPCNRPDALPQPPNRPTGPPRPPCDRPATHPSSDAQGPPQAPGPRA